MWARKPRSCASRELAERHHLWVLGQFDQFAWGNPILFIGLMRMGADRAIDVRKSLRDRKQRAETPHPRRYRDDAPYPGGFRARDNAVEIVGKVGKVEVAVAVDKHRIATVQAAVGST